MLALIKDKGPRNHLVLLVSHPCSLQADVLSDQSTHNTDSFQSGSNPAKLGVIFQEYEQVSPRRKGTFILGTTKASNQPWRSLACLGLAEADRAGSSIPGQVLSTALGFTPS